MKQFINYSAVAVSAMFIAVGCGGSGGSNDGSGGGDGNNSTSQAEPTTPVDTELVYLKVAGMT